MFSVGQSIKRARIRNLLTQRELSERSGVTIRTIQNIENDMTEPGFFTVIRLAEVLKISLDSIAKGE